MKRATVKNVHPHRRERGARPTRHELRRFLARALAIMAVASFLIGSSEFRDSILAPYAAFIAANVRLILRCTGTIVTGAGPDVVLAHSSVQVVTGCTALDVTALILAALVSFPATWRSKVSGAFACVIGLYVVNLLRIAALAQFGERHPTHFNDVHLIYAQVGMIIIAVGMWLAWVTNCSAYAYKNRTLVCR